MVKTCGSFAEIKKPEHAVKLFVRFALAKGLITYSMELMLALLKIIQGIVSSIINAAGFGAPNATVCLEGAVIVLACIIFSVFASSPPAVDPNAAAASMVWSYIGELVFNMLILVGSIKMSDHVVREMMGL